MSKTLSEQLRDLEIQLETAVRERDAHAEEIKDRAATEASLAQELYACIGERDAYEEEMNARGQSLANVAAERDALAVKLEKVQTDCIDCLNSRADDDFERGMDAQCETTLAILNADYSAPSETPPKMEQGAEPFRVTGPGFYRQRDGEKAEVRYIDPYPSATVTGYFADGSHGAWFTHGKQYSDDTQTPTDLVAPWVEPAGEPGPEYDVIEREIALHVDTECDTDYLVKDVYRAERIGAPIVARATVQFKVPRPAKPKVTASVTFHDSANDYLVQMPDAPLVGQPGHMREGIHKYITREQAIALRDALVAAKLEEK